MSVKKRVLFVDDDIHVLQGLRRGLSGMRDSWEMVFALGGKEALDAMDSFPLDAVVTDMRMPEIDGLIVLTEASRKHPLAARIVLSGQIQPELVILAASITHVILLKPCDIDLIRSRVERALLCNDRLRNVALKRLIAEATAIPSVPMLFLEVVSELEKTIPDGDRIRSLISMDLGMAATVLRLANSGYFGAEFRTSNPGRAVDLIGVGLLRRIITAAGAGPATRPEEIRPFDPIIAWWQSAALRANCEVVQVAGNPAGAEDAFAARLFHDLGQVVLATVLGTLYDTVLERTASTGESLCEVESELIGATHAEVGAHILGLWGMPDAVVDAVFQHHCSRNIFTKEFAALKAAHLAEAIERQELIEIFNRERLLDLTHHGGRGLEDHPETSVALRDANAASGPVHLAEK